MTDLPPAIAAFFATEASTEAAALGACFAADAEVHDAARDHRGRAAIIAWRLATQAATPFATRVLDWHEEAGRILVAAEVAGRFPNSPVRLRQAFTLDRGLIAALDIR